MTRRDGIPSKKASKKDVPKKRKPESKGSKLGCACFPIKARELKKNGYELRSVARASTAKMTFIERAVIALVPIQKFWEERGVKNPTAPHLLANYCPFCGKKYRENKSRRKFPWS